MSEQLFIGLIAAVSGLVGAIIGAIVGPYLRECFRLWRDQNATYLVPFKRWCTRLYGDLSELCRRYLADKCTHKIHKCCGKDITFNFGVELLAYSSALPATSPVLLLDDYRALHDVLMDAPEWFGKIIKDERDDTELRTAFLALMETVDRYWHKIETQYIVHLGSREDIITKLGRSLATEATKVKKHLKDKWEMDLSRILTYLYDQIP